MVVVVVALVMVAVVRLAVAAATALVRVAAAKRIAHPVVAVAGMVVFVLAAGFFIERVFSEVIPAAPMTGIVVSSVGATTAVPAMGIAVAVGVS